MYRTKYRFYIENAFLFAKLRQLTDFILEIIQPICCTNTLSITNTKMLFINEASENRGVEYHIRNDLSLMKIVFDIT
jgi:hypothetical protein